MTPSTPLVMVSDRLPVQWTDGEGWARSPGGLVTAVDSVVKRLGCDWIGYARAPRDAGVVPSWGGATPIRVDVADDVHERAIAGFANRVLWPALHGMAEFVAPTDQTWHDYLEYNRAVTDHVEASSSDEAVVWVHDYQLALVPGLLRERRPQVRVGLSIHTPFELALPADPVIASSIADSLGAADVVGVQTSGDLCGLRRFVGREDIGIVSPVSVDVDRLDDLARDPVTTALAARELVRSVDRFVIVGIDRLDYTKALVERLNAYELAFRHATLRPDEVRIVQVAEPTRGSIPEYRNIRLYAERLAHDIGARYPRADGSSPLEFRTERIDRREVVALLSVADLCVVAPRRDGMNLVAKEFSIVNEPHGGVLILSEGAGAHDELGDASISVATVDPDALVDGLRRAMGTSSVQRRSMASARARIVRSWTASDWSEHFMDHFGA